MSTPCDLERLESLVFGELDRDAARATQEHLQVCAACAAELEALQLTRASLSGPHRRVPERVGHLYPLIAERVAARKSVRRQLGGMALTFASLCAVVFVSTASERTRVIESIAETCVNQCVEPPVCEMSNADEIESLEQRFSACLIATPAQLP